MSTLWGQPLQRADLVSLCPALPLFCSDIFCAGRVPEDDMERTRLACGGAVQTSVNNMTTDVLGLCERFEERQVRRWGRKTRGWWPMIFISVASHCRAARRPPSFQVGGDRYNFFEGCPKAKTCTIVMRGGAAQFIEETERSLHDAIMIVRRAIKNDSVVAGGGAIEVGEGREWGIALFIVGASCT
jgi:T-complex protein 1 subunit eta